MPEQSAIPATPAVLDLGAVLAAMQDQIDDLTAAVEAQQRIIDDLLRKRRDREAGRGRNRFGAS